MSGARARRNGQRLGWTLLLCLGAAQAAERCPDPSERLALQQAAASATAAVEEATAADLQRVHAAWQRTVDAARACAGDKSASVLEAQALADWSAAARSVGDGDALYRIETTRLALAHRDGLMSHLAESAGRLGVMLIARGEFDLARQRLGEARDAFFAIGDLSGAANAHSQLSRLERRVGDYLAALREELASLHLRRQMPEPPDLWRSLLSIAVLYEQIELFDESRRRYAEALAEAERTGAEGNVADVLSSYAGFLNDFGATDAAQALTMAERALPIQAEVGDRARVSSSLLQIGRAQMNLGRFAEADTAMREALRHAQETGSRSLEAHLQFRLGELALLRGDSGAALALVTKAREAYEKQGNRHRLVKVHGVLERLHAQRGDELESVRSGREHYRLRNELLGANATGKFGELLSNFMLGEERLRNERLQQANALAEVSLENERRMRLAMLGLAATIALALLVLAWRHVSTRRLYALLHEKNRQIEAQGRQLAQINAELTEHSRELLERNQTDALTRVGSRAHGMQRLADLLARRVELGTRPAMLMIDIDHFKQINDRHGHLAGDQVLVMVANALQGALPAGAELSRLGGEEFMVLLHHAAPSQATVLADTLRRRVRDLRVDLGSQTVQVTISVGVCDVPAAPDTALRDVLASADRALYAAKRDGRDCVRVAAEAC